MSDAPEWRLQHFAHMLLERIVLEPCWITGVEDARVMMKGSREALMRMEQRRRARGIRPHHLDHVVYQAPLYTQIELKYGKGKPTEGQEATMRLLSERGIPTACCWTIMQIYEHMRSAGFRLHGNAENIAREIEARWRAADEAKRGAAPAKKRSRGPAIRRANGVPPSLEEMGWFD